MRFKASKTVSPSFIVTCVAPSGTSLEDILIDKGTDFFSSFGLEGVGFGFGFGFGCSVSLLYDCFGLVSFFGAGLDDDSFFVTLFDEVDESLFVVLDFVDW